MLGKADFQRALELSMSDFEDAVQAAAALEVGADYLVTLPLQLSTAFP